MKIQIKNLSKIYGKNPKKILSLLKKGSNRANVLAEHQHVFALKNVSLSIASSEIFVVMGLSGSGKSTLVRHLNRLIEPTSGEIIVDGENILQFSPLQLREYRRLKVAMVFQKFGLLPHKTVLQNVAYGLKIRHVGEAERIECAAHWIEKIGLQEFKHHLPSQLSGGMQQRVGLARALANSPDILLMDEPFSALDPLIRREMQAMLLQLQQELQKTIVFITHDVDEAFKIGNRIAILKDGEVAQLGTPDDLLENPKDEYIEAFVQDIRQSRNL